MLLMERCKLVVEGAGAVGVAALLGGQVTPTPRGTTVAVLSGGNVDAGAAARRSPAATRTRPAAGSCCSRACPTVRAGSSRCSRCVADTGANIVDVSHVREGLDLHVRETAVELVLETRGHEHAEARARRACRDAGYEAEAMQLIAPLPARWVRDEMSRAQGRRERCRRLEHGRSRSGRRSRSSARSPGA